MFLILTSSAAVASEDDTITTVLEDQPHKTSGGSTSSTSGSTTSSDGGSSSINFCAIGDWGGREWFPYFTYAQRQTAMGMGSIAESRNAQFVVALGDNFYHSGVDAKDSSYRFQRTFQDVYNAASLTNIPWYVIGGNHDHYGNITAQIAYSQENPEGRWVFPSLYHSHSFSAPDGSFTIDLILIDTVDLCGNNEIQDETMEGCFDPLPLKDKDSDAKVQWEWIENQMKNSTADYLLVGGHFPVYSACSHGPTETLIHHLKPLLQEYNAHYLSGHDHCMMHYEEEDVHFVLSGMGDECCYEAPNNDDDDHHHHHLSLNPEPGALKWLVSKENKDLYQAIGGFTSFQATAQEMKIQYHDHRGNVLFTADPVPPRVVNQ
ncbi:MAG: hypothetical protein SGBAC_009088 [Bacillariaceae sp.]